MACRTKSDTPPAPAVNRDSVVVYGWYKMASDFLGVNNDSALHYTRIGMDYADSVGYERGVALGYYNLGLWGYYTNQFDSAIYFYNTSINYYKISRIVRSLAFNMLQLGIIHFDQDSLIEAGQYFDSAFIYFEEANDSSGIGNALVWKGSVLEKNGNYKTALEYYLKALKYSESTKDKYTIYNINARLAGLFEKLEEFDKAQTYLEKALYASKDMPEWECTILMQRAGVFLKNKQFKKAYSDLKQAKTYYKHVGDLKGTCNADVYLGFLFYLQKDYPNAIAFTDSALWGYKFLNMKTSIGRALYNLAGMWTALEDYQKAESYFKQSLQYINATNDAKTLRNIYQEFSQMYDSAHNYKQAYNFYRSYKQLDDSLYNEKKARQMAQMEMQYQFDQKEKIVRLEQEKKEMALNNEINKQKTFVNYSLIFTFILLLLITIGFILYRNYQRSKFLILEQNLQLNLQKALTTQMNPHFIFNCLNSLRSLIMDNKAEEADQHFMIFARLMRLTLNHSQEKTVSLQSELEALQMYVRMEQLRFKERFVFQLKVDDGIDKDMVQVPSMLIQPFVENAIIHGLASKKTQGILVVYISRELGLLKCIIDDNGIGRKYTHETNENNKHQSYGVSLTQQRIELLGQLYNTNIKVKITDKIEDNGLPAGTRVEFNLPLTL